MCGIFFSLSRSNPVLPTKETLAALESRGPDSTHTHHVHFQTELHPTTTTTTTTTTTSSKSANTSVHLTFISTVLALRGDYIQTQPLVDTESNSVLCWNGEAWKINGEYVQGNDTQVIFNQFLDASQHSTTSAFDGCHGNDQSLQRLCRVISSISGPFSFIFYDASHARLYFSRDYLGRRSLLQTFDDNGDFILCSISSGVPLASFDEVETTGLCLIDFSSIQRQDSIQDHAMADIPIQTIDWLLEPQGDLCHLVRRGFKV
jgi:asparagine synthetase B (glutamine-hydrolysing)